MEHTGDTWEECDSNIGDKYTVFTDAEAEKNRYYEAVEIAFKHPITQQCMTLKKVFNDVRIKKIKS